MLIFLSDLELVFGWHSGTIPSFFLAHLGSCCWASVIIADQMQYSMNHYCIKLLQPSVVVAWSIFFHSVQAYINISFYCLDSLSIIKSDDICKGIVLQVL